MDICSHIGLSDTDHVNDLHELCMNTLESTHGVLEDFSVDELGNGVTKFLNIPDDSVGDSSSTLCCKKFEFQKEDVCGESQKKDVCEKSHQSKIMFRAPEKCLGKCASLNLSSTDAVTSEISSQGDGVKSVDPSSFRSLSLPTQLKPVSAMKGSREKRGVAPPMKLTVKWAPDVYDPIPTSVSHVVTNNRPSRHSKKNSRNKQKNGGKSSRGSKGKDKKQVRKRGGSSSGMGYKLPEHEEEMVAFREHEPQPSGIDFHVGNPDQFCGSSFLKRYGTSLHVSSVAEAT